MPRALVAGGSPIIYWRAARESGAGARHRKADLATDLLDGTGVHLLPEPGGVAAHRIAAGPRVGVRLAADRPWRFWIDGERSVSAYRRHPDA